MSLAKLATTTYAPGTPGSPGSPGRPATPAYCSTENVSSCKWVPNAAIHYELRTGTRTVYLDGVTPSQESYSFYIPVPPNVPATLWQCSSEPVTTCYPEQAAVSAVPGVPATAAQTAYNKACGWSNGRARSLATMDVGKAIRFKVSSASIGVFVGVDSLGSDAKQPSAFAHGLMIDSTGVHAYEAGAFVNTLAATWDSSTEFLISRPYSTKGAVTYAISGGASYTSATSAVGPLYTYTALYAGGDVVSDSGYEDAADAWDASITGVLQAVHGVLAENEYLDLSGAILVAGSLAELLDGFQLSGVFQGVVGVLALGDYFDLNGVTLTLAGRLSEDGYTPAVPDNLSGTLLPIMGLLIEVAEPTFALSGALVTIQGVLAEVSYIDLRGTLPALSASMIEDAAPTLLSLFSSMLLADTCVLTRNVELNLDESGCASDVACPQSQQNVAVNETASGADVLQVCFTQLMADSSAATEIWFLGIAPTIIDIALATGQVSTQLAATQAISEVVVALDLYQKGLLENIVDSASAAEAITLQVNTVQQILEQAAAADTSSSYVAVFNSITESANATDTLTAWQQLSYAISEGATAFVKLNIGGEIYTGWVLNTQAGAVSEYQGLSFNSMAKINGRYFGATDQGIVELTGDQDSGKDISFYIQGGLLDFGTSKLKSMTYGYLATDSAGRIALGIAVSEKSGASTDWYEVATDEEAIGNVRLPIGRGYRGRYWKFSIAGTAMKSFEAITLLPVVLSRRV